MLIQKIKSFMEALFSAKASNRVRILYLVIITIIVEPILISTIWNSPSFKNVLYARIVHVIMAWCILVYLLLNKKIKKNVGLVLFSMLFLTLAFPLWFNQESIVASGAQDLTFIPVHALFFSVAILYSGSFVLNSAFLFIFTAEIFIIWVKYSSHYDPKEPLMTLSVSFICFIILLFRNQDEKTYRNYLREQYRSNVMANLARMFLSLRDKTNTPVQSLLLISGLLSPTKPLSEEVIQNFNNSVKRLKETADQLKKYETLLQRTAQDSQLVTDQEIEEWISNLEKEEQAENN